MADALDSQSIARRSFEVSRRGYEQQEVRAFLHEVSSLLDRLQREGAELRERAERSEARLGLADHPDETMLLEILGEETTRVLTSAREAASEIRAKAEAAAERVISEATLEAAEARAEAVQGADRRVAEAAAESEALLAEARRELDRRRAEADDAATRIHDEATTQAQALRDEAQREVDRMQVEREAELEAARTKGREMVAEAQAVRERVLRDLAVRRKKARQQVEKLNAGRERLLQAYDVVRRTVDEATDELSTALSDARLAADAAGRRIDEEPEPTLEQLDDEIYTGALVDLPLVEPDEPDEDPPGLPSGEGSVVETVPEEPPVADPTSAAELQERRGRKGRRRKEDFGGLSTGSLTRIEPPAAGEGIRILTEPAIEPAAVAAEPDAVAPEPEPQAVEPEPETVQSELEPLEVPSTAAAGAEAPEGEDPASVQDLFARLRAGQPEDDAPTETSGTAPVLEEETVDAPFATRDTALEAIDKELGRRLKRALADEQNEVLDRLRRVKPKGVDDLLPEPDDHAGRWAEVASPALVDAASAGAASSGGSAGPIADLADELARSLTAPLRDRVERGFAASDGNLEEVAERVRALYREWKGQRLAESSRHATAAAYARGSYDGLGPGAAVRWVLDPRGGPCPDCDDNVLGGTLVKGADFPTGHQCAPAHPGCRCLVLPVED